MLTALLLTLASAQAYDVELRNDTNYDDVFDAGEAVIWLDYPECAISVLTPDAYPVEVDAIQFFFASSSGSLEGESGYTELGVQLVDEDAAPSGRGDWIWGEEAFQTTVSNEALNELYIVDAEAGWDAITIEEGSIAVWLCPSDPATQADWPYNSSTDVSGILVDSASPSDNNYVLYGGKVVSLKSLGVPGSWIIRAVGGAEGGGEGGGDDGGGDGGDDGGSGDLDVVSISPPSMMQGEGGVVAIVGEGFDDDAEAYIGGLILSAVEVTGDNALTAQVPITLPAGIHDVVVKNPAGGTATLSAGFTVLDSEEVDGGGGCGCATGSLAPLLALGWLPAAWAAFRRRRED